MLSTKTETWPDPDFWLGQDKYFEVYNCSQWDFKSKAVSHIKELAIFEHKLADIKKKLLKLELIRLFDWALLSLA